MNRVLSRRPAAPAPAVAPPAAAASPLRLGLGAWSLYFLAKLALYWQGLIGFHPLENLAFAAFLLLPAETVLRRRLRLAAAVPAAGALLYYDSWLPPLSRALSQGSLLADFSFGYLLELAGRFVNWQVLALLAIVWVAFVFVSRWLRTGVLAVLAMAVLAFQQPGAKPAPAAAAAAPAGNAKAEGATDLDGTLRAFYSQESQRQVAFPAPAAGDAPFDVIFLHVCSLSWDDLQAVGLDGHRLWQRFDFLFTRFNSAASYSGPAAIRIQRATCGQTQHTALYSQAPASCYLMGSLQQAGYEPALALNHDGHFDDFLGSVRKQAGMATAPLVPLTGVPVAQRAFDDSPIYDDLAVLSRWLENRPKAGPRVAAYYNTISLHDGNRLNGSSKGSIDTYKIRLAKFLDDTDAFLTRLEQSGRRAVVVLIPEHGAAVRGDRMQIAGLREIPSPAITRVPVGIKVVGPDARRQGETTKVEASTSYLAVSHVVARMLEATPFGAQGFAPANYLADLPTTPYVAENEGTVIMEYQGRYFLRQDKDGWVEYGKAP